MKYVICFYWTGERWHGSGYQEEKITDVSFQRHAKRVGPVDVNLSSKYVNNLYLGVKKWSEDPFKFICFTNDKLILNKDIEVRPFQLVTDKGVLPRMFMFSEAAGLFGHQILCLDIDVIITGSLKDIMSYQGSFCTRSSWARGEEHLIDGDIMSFRAGKETEDIFWNPFVNNLDQIVGETGGRERMWVRKATGNKADLWQTLVPGQVCSYKRHVRKVGVPKNARIVSCHGFPRPHQINEQWRMEQWR